MRNKKVLLLIVLLTAQFGFGQISFFENEIDSTNDIVLNIANGIVGLTTRNIHSADFDGDGDQDLILQSRPFTWIENTDGLGTYTTNHIIDENMSPGNLKISDVDNDGDLDVVVIGTSIDSYQLSWYENTDGLGTFSTIQTISNTISGFTTLDVKDIDGDSDVDIVIASTGDGKIAWYQNINNGVFSAEQVITNASIGYTTSIISVSIADLDGDNYNDIIYSPKGSPDQKTYWLKNTNGQGSFGTPQELHDHFGGITYFNLIDLDNDGDKDFYYQGAFNTFAVLFNDGLGNFISGNTFYTAYENFIGFSKAIDLDGDSDLDMLTFVSNHDTFDNQTNEAAIVWFENTDGLGTYSNEQILRTVNYTGSFLFNTVDVDGDNLEDIVCTDLDGYELSWNKNEASQSTFSDSKEIINDLKGVSDVLSADVDSDGDKDIVFVSPNKDTLGWYENTDGNGDFSNQKIISVEGNYFWKIEAVDIDNNNTIDLIAESRDDDKIWVYKNTDGLGDFILHQTITNSSTSSRGFKMVDVDNDGNKDIVSLQNFGDKLVWHKNTDGLGNFGAEEIITDTINDLDFYEFSDLDNDGDLDIVLISPFSWLENVNSNFNAPQNIQTNESIKRVLLFDVDLDNDNDVFVYYSNAFGWFENTDGQANFGSLNAIDNINSVGEILIDIDNDNDLDIISQKRFSSNLDEIKLVLYKNINGNFSDQILIDENERFSDISVCNFDGSKNDILYSTSLSNGKTGKLGWYRNLGVLQNQITGSVIYDSNNNGCDVNDLSIGNALIITSSNGYSFSTFTENDGTFLLNVSQGDLYTYLMPDENNYFNAAPSFYLSEFDNEDEVDNLAPFCRTAPLTKNDLNIIIYPLLNDPRPGFDTTYQIVYKNVGTTELSGNVTFEYDNSKLNFLNASETSASQTANTITFDYTNLNPFETRTIDLEFNIFAPPTTNIDDVLVSTVTVNPVTGDNTTEDNIFSLNQTVIGSYDPNDIRVLEGEQILLADADKYLHYIIRFQNTGTASAINVNVENILDSKLDWTTMQLESLSHTGRVEITDGSLVKFIFNTINLPDSTSDEPNSHGFIAYKIKPKSNVVVGDIFNSTADIFFDFNPAIVTNTVSTEIVNTLSVEEFETTGFSIYPNPTNSILNIEGKAIFDVVTIYDINGRLLKTVNFSSNKGNLDVTNLSQGLYFIEIRSGKSIETLKFIKK